MATGQSPYTLNSGQKGIEEGRLDFQHHVFLKQTDNKLIPESVAAHLSSLHRPVAVADVGTGTGIWIQHLAAQLPPTSRLDGYDFDTSKFSDASKIPGNVKLAFADAMKPFPQEILGIYDLVHVRCLMFALRSHEWEIVAANLRTLLQPGGYLFWEELGYPTWVCLPMTETFSKWITTDVRYAASVGRSTSSPLHLKNQVQGVGYANVARQEWSTFSLTQSEQEDAGKVINAAGRQSMHGIVDRGGFEWLKTHQDADEAADMIQSEIDSCIAQIGFTMYWVIGQNSKN